MRNSINYHLFGLLFLFSFFVPSTLAEMSEYEQLLYHIKRKQHLQVRRPGFLGPVQTGRVRAILSANTVKLENGAKIKLLGIDSPLLYGKTPQHECFDQEMKAYLQHHLLGRRVILRKDRTDFAKGMYLKRYVYLPGWDKHEKEIFFNAQMIRHGYAKSFFSGKDVQHKESFSQLIQKVYRDPKGAWSYCLSQN